MKGKQRNITLISNCILINKYNEYLLFLIIDLILFLSYKTSELCNFDSNIIYLIVIKF